MKFRIEKRIKWSENLLSPTPLVIDDENCLIFLGKQKQKGESSQLIALRMMFKDGKKEVQEVEIVDQNHERRFMNIGILGELPTYATCQDDSIVLIMAGFQPEVLMKHRLVYYIETLNFEKDEMLVRSERYFNEELLVKYSEEHTIAGASVFENNLTVAYGTEWIHENDQLVPRTEIGIVNGSNLHKHPEFNFNKMDCLALARPIRTKLNDNQVLWSVSKRLTGSRYLSEIFIESEQTKTLRSIELEIFLGDKSYINGTAIDFTYFFPFWWHGKLYASATTKYTGEEGFYILEQVLD